MSEQFQKAAQNYYSALDEITKNNENYLSFLNLMGNLFKAPRTVQVLVWRHNPYSIAALSKEGWEKYNYQCEDENSILIPSGKTIKKFFSSDDILRTESSVPIKVWHFDDNDTAEVNAVISKKLGVNIVGNNILETVSAYAQSISNSESKNDNLFRFSLQDILLSRLGKETTDNYGYVHDLSGLNRVSLEPLIQQLNTAAQGFLEIIKEVSIKNGRCIDYTFDKEKPIKYNRNVINSKGEMKNDKQQTRVDNSSRELGRDKLLLYDSSGSETLHSDRGIHDSKAMGRDTSGELQQVLGREMELSQGEQSKVFDRTSASGTQKRRNVNKTHGRNIRENARTTPAAGKRNNETRWDTRITGKQLLEVCTRAYKRLDESGGNLEGRNNLQLNLFDSIVKSNRIETVELDENNSTVFVYKNFEKSILSGSGVSEGKFRIYEFFSNNNNKLDRTNFLKKEYGIGGGSFQFVDNTNGLQQQNSNGLSLTNQDEQTIHLSWSEVASLIDILVSTDNYLSNNERVLYQKYLEKSKMIEQRKLFVNEVRSLVTDESAVSSETIITLKNNVHKIANTFVFEGSMATAFNDTKSAGKHIYDFLQACSKETDISNDARTLLSELRNIDPNLFKRSIIQEYYKLKKEYPSNIVLMEVGDFYETFDVDAQTVAREIDLVITARNEDDKKIPMSGFPKHSLERYVNKLVKLGYIVAVATLDEDNVPDKTYNIVPVNNEPVLLTHDLKANSVEEIIEEPVVADVENEKKYFNLKLFEKSLSHSNHIKTGTHRNFITLANILPAILNMDVSYIRMEAGEGFMPLVIERIGDNRISITHYYKQMGDMMADPDMEFVFDIIKQELRPRTYQQDNMGIYQSVERDDGSINFILEEELSRFTEKWLNNINSQGYIVDNIIYNYENDDLRLYFNEEGNVYKIEPEIVSDNLCNAFNVILAEKTKRELEVINDENQEKDSVKAVSSKDSYIDTIDNEIITDKTSSIKISTKEDITNYQITDDNLGIGTASKRFKANVEAIRILKQVESEQRMATPEEQSKLSKYVGWGGLSDVFNEKHTAFRELRSLLTDDEYSAARSSTLTAFYTPPAVIRSIYTVLQNMGFERGNILEPSCGVGNFFGLLPDRLSQKVNLSGVEIDSISGRIAKQLYPNADIQVKGFENTSFEDNYFDVVIGNVPFGQFSVSDKTYDKYHFLIHDYFFAKALDKVRPGGIVAFITSKGTLDKNNPTVRKYIAKKADLLGAIRLPNNTFKEAAGTEVTSDIIFLQKRQMELDIEPDWVYLNENEDGIVMNNYFIVHPNMILGNMEMVSTAYGHDSACLDNGKDLAEQLNVAISNITGDIKNFSSSFELTKNEDEPFVPAIDGLRDYAYAIINGKLYQRQEQKMLLCEVSDKVLPRYESIINVRDACQSLIDVQVNNASDEVVLQFQKKLNSAYDGFSEKYGRISDKSNSRIFKDDPSYSLLVTLEVFDAKGNYIGKSDMFTRRTIRPNHTITHARNSNDALAASLNIKGKIDMQYMVELTGFTKEQIEKDLENIIFKIPNMEINGTESWVTADEYLSGNVRTKLEFAKLFKDIRKENWIQTNINALEKVQPKPLKASEIQLRIGATWIPTDIIDDFMYQLFNTKYRTQIKTEYSDLTDVWCIRNKNWEDWSVAAKSTYGTSRVSSYQVLEDCLNMKDTVIRDRVNEDGKEKYIVNEKETRIAQGKQKLIKQAFDSWIWNEPNRRKRLENIYNKRFNSSIQRKYDGSHLTFDGMNAIVNLRQHQKNAVARCLYGGNTLLAHCVGAGKTYEMCAAAMEAKRIGLCTKSMIVVPNNIVGQFGSEFMNLYPNANILVTTEKDFSKENRRRFCSRIATNNYDAVIIGHSQFEKIPLSKDTEEKMLRSQLNEVIEGINYNSQESNRLTVKQLERSRKSIESRLKKLSDIEQDDVITFEQLGVDKLFVDEAHNYKNLFLYTKMSNVAGINTTEAKKSTDLFNKVRWLDEKTGGKGTVFATGTPVSNTMAELYTMQRYLQYDRLRELGLLHFDAWASTFGETTNELELKPEGTGFRLKKRFAKFFNVPELMSVFREIADIQTKEMLNLPLPKVIFENMVSQPSKLQQNMVRNLAERADEVRNGSVRPDEDNMLLITSDGRKLALDQRIIDDSFPDNPESKVNNCVNNVYRIMKESEHEKLTQLIFCDLSTPLNKKFNVYDDIKSKLIALGVPEEEIAFAHDANTNAQKEALNKKVRNGSVRIMIGSTQKCGTGTNVQDKLIAIHDLDCPWRPADLEQRLGRIERQGNSNKEVYCYRYVTEGTFDAYMYQLVEKKQHFISQIMQGDTTIREIEDLDESSLNYAKLKALATGNPLIQEKMELELQIRDLMLQKQNHNAEIYALQDRISFEYPKQISKTKIHIKSLKEEIDVINQHSDENFIIFNGEQIDDVKKIGSIINSYQEYFNNNSDKVNLGLYKGLAITLTFDKFFNAIVVHVGENSEEIMKLDAITNGKRVLGVLDGITEKYEKSQEILSSLETDLENAQVAVKRTFPMQAELDSKKARLDELDKLFEEEQKQHKQKQKSNDMIIQ